MRGLSPVEMQMESSITLGAEFTIEQALDIDTVGQTNNYPFYVTSHDDFGVFTRKASSNRTLEWKADDINGLDYASRPTQTGWQGPYLTALATDTHCYLFQGTSYANGLARKTASKACGTYKWLIGGVTGNLAPDRHSKGLYYATRIYNRPLTEAELARNRKVDDIRFRGMVVTNVVVASAHAEAQGVEPNGVYEVEGAWTFTVQPTVLESGRTARPIGYTIETLTADGWRVPSRHNGLSYTYTAGADPVRLTWRYQPSGTTVIVR